jgi:hypothetical protein
MQGNVAEYANLRPITISECRSKQDLGTDRHPVQLASTTPGNVTDRSLGGAVLIKGETRDETLTAGDVTLNVMHVHVARLAAFSS